MKRELFIKFELNGLNITPSIKKYIHRIALDDVFDTDFTISKLQIEVDANYKGRWEYKDQVVLSVGWTDSPSDLLVTNIFHLDYFEDNKTNGGQTYFLNFLEADLAIGFTYGGKITLTNKTLKTAIADFKTAFPDVTVEENFASNVYVGTIPIPPDYQVGAVLPNNNTVSKTFDSWNQLLYYICRTYGYYGNISGTKFTFLKLGTIPDFEADFVVPNFDTVLDVGYIKKFTVMYNRVTALYANSSRVLDFADATNFYQKMQGKNLELTDDGAYFNGESAREAAIAQMRLTYLEAFRIAIKSIGFPGFKAGRKFYLSETYGQYSESYICLKCTHDISPSGWISTIEGYPTSGTTSTIPDFKSEYLGTITVISDFTFTQIISSNLPTSLNATWLDNFARNLNSAYGQNNLGSFYLSEGATEGIRADLAFCQMLVETNNWRENTRISKNNYGGLGNAAGTDFAIFSSFQNGVRAQIQHLFAYAVPSSGAGSRPLQNAVIDPRYNNVSRGSAKTATTLTGKWQSASGYGQAIVDKMVALYKYLGYRNPTVI